MSNNRAVRPVAVIGGNRIPFAKSNGPYAHASNQDMLTTALNGLVSRFGLSGARLDEVAGGAVLKHSRDFNLTRESVLGSRLDPTTPAFDLQRACGTSLEATTAVANKIALGQIDAGVACGVDTTSDAPIGVNEDFRRLLLDFNRAKSLGKRLGMVTRLRPKQVVPEIPRNAEPRTGLSMGEHAARTATKWGITREAQDSLAVTSHQRLAAAYDRGFFDDLVTGYLGVTRDGLLRGDTTAEKLARLRPVFGGPDGTMTAGNSSPLSDGAATVLLSSDAWAKERRLPVAAHLVDVQAGAVDFVGGDDGLLTAPVFIVPKLLARNNLKLSDFDFIEMHEAFASQVLATLAAWEDAEFCATRLGLDAPLGGVDRDRLNVNGSSLATGHPFAATGARIVATAAKLLADKGSGRALISICAAGGQGVTAILERQAR
ncbi:MAG TPA: acetyl-CoA C-acetyltransferase [Stackebrandtia sp.]|jgi:acetyl-CoA C-acetyltransferase|uniref:acetyl-CoA C-acetyltransferase n=1 Tax=Stackebrandtia sp. TaxID=2023065 RepID=UPI002D6F3F7D|nr:acetyl-CoA C-acetyltransferase [Stackebrandtia sp.]HZE41739.1 acetyl-CoA C-acetyltransferase [Stackebrandtia sp.]